VENENIHMHLYTNPSQGYMPDEVLAKARELFDQAEAVVDGNEDLLDRIRVARMPLSYARIFPRNGYKIENGKMAFQGDVAPIEETQAFIGLMKEKGFATIREMGGDPNELMMWSMAGNNPLDVPTIKNEFLTVDMALFVGGRVLRITDNKTGECVTANNTTRCLYFPFCGGDEIRLGGTTFISGLAGNMEVYVPAGEATETEFAMETATGGFKVRRTVSLAPDKPVLTITTEATNTTDKPRKSRLRSHLELDMGPLRETKVNFTDRTGQEVAPSMEAILANLREGEHYYDEAAPKGEWTFTGTEGLKLVQRFDDASVNQTWIYAYPDYLNDLEVEVWGQETVVEPGKSMVFSHSLEVLPIAE
ncbi:MAG: hypothetical protein GY851_34595, partial [bacterium]|nr:hypothetical protein [bacterium]